MKESRIRLLVLYANYTDRLSYYDDWFDAFSTYPGFATTTLNIVSLDADLLRRKLTNVDAIVLLHSTNGDTTGYLEPFASELADRRVPLLSFVGNEVNLPGSPISAKRRVFAEIAPDWIATQLLPEAGEYLFGDLVRRSVVSIPHALNRTAFRPIRSDGDRPIDIGTRIARYVPHLGDNERNRLVEAFAALGAEGKWRIDISGPRFDRAGWADFLNLCRGTIATEAGSWFLERDDSTVEAIRGYIANRSRGLMITNDSPLRKFGHKLPSWLRAKLRQVLGSGLLRHEAVVNETMQFEDIYDRFFAGRERAAVYGKCISSRHFDAIGTKTCQIMFAGRYNDILLADRHYLALDKDFGNLEDVMQRFSDMGVRRTITEEAYAYVTATHTYAHRLRQVEQILAGAPAMNEPGVQYSHGH